MKTPTVGLDMAQRSFAAALWFGPGRVLKIELENTARGFRRLALWLKQHGAGRVTVAVESTNVYWEPVAEWLHARGHAVYILNAERVKRYAQSLGQRNKTDAADAVTIARYIAYHEATPWLPPSPEQKDLRSLTRARHQLLEVLLQLGNQLRTASGAGRQHLEALRRATHNELKKLGLSIAQHLRAFPALRERVRRLMTVKGVGLVTAATAVAELPPITAETDPRAIAGWAGLTPRRHQSGNCEWRARLCRKGNAYLRNALYMPALVAKRHNPVLRSFAEKLAASGKTHGAILGAISHKMLRILVGLLRTNTDFDPQWSPKKI